VRGKVIVFHMVQETFPGKKFSYDNILYGVGHHVFACSLAVFRENAKTRRPVRGIDYSADNHTKKNLRVFREQKIVHQSVAVRSRRVFVHTYRLGTT